jgi:DNA repair ATPase RecN
LQQWVQNLDKYKPLADTGKYPGKKKIDSCLETTGKLLNIHDSYELIKKFNSSKDDLTKASNYLHDLKDFYTNQKDTWETLSSAMDKFQPNRTALEKDSEAGKALQRMTHILNAASPYGMLKEVNSLISKVESVNEGLVKERRTSAIESLDDMISQISNLLKENKAKDNFSNNTLMPIQNIKKKIQTENSIPHITYNVNEAERLLEEALEAIDEEFVDKGGNGEEPKQIKTIKPASLKQKAYLDTEDDVNVFVNKVKDKLLDVVRKNIRVRIE